MEQTVLLWLMLKSGAEYGATGEHPVVVAFECGCNLTGPLEVIQILSLEKSLLLWQMQ